MKIETTIRDDHQAQLAVELDTEALEKFMHRASRKISQDSKIPGFRPGKAPYDVVRRIYGDQALQQQAVELMVDEIYPEIIKEAGLEPAGPGSLNKIESIDPPKFEFLVPLAPKVELSDYRTIRHEYNPPSVTDEEVDAVIMDVRRRTATAEPVERPAEEGDLVYLMVKSTFADPAEGEDPEFMKGTPYQVVIGEDTDEEKAWPYVGFSKELLGTKSGDLRDVEYTYADDSRYEKLRARKVVFQVEVQSVKAFELPELDDEFAHNMGEFENMVEMRKTVHDQLEVNKIAEYDDVFVSGVIDEVIENSTIKFAPQTLDDEVEHILEHLKEDLAQQRMDLETYLKTRQMEKDAFIDAEVKPSAIKRLQRSLVIEQLARTEKIAIKTEDLQSMVTQRLMEMQNSPYFNQKKPNNAQMRELTNTLMLDTASRLLSQRTVERLRDIASGNLEKVEQEMAEVAADQSVDQEAADTSSAGDAGAPAVEDTGTGEGE